MNEIRTIWIASYPKSGNQWISSLLRAAGANYGFPQEPPGIYQMIASNKLPAMCPAVAEDIRAKAPCAVVKTHAVYRSKNDILHTIGNSHFITAGFISIYRNPLDVLLSYINFSRNEYKSFAESRPYKTNLFQELLGFENTIEYTDWRGMTLDTIPRKNLDHALQRFSEGGLRIPTLDKMAGSWDENVGSWHDAAEHFPSVILRYEDCIENPARLVELSKLFSFTEQDVEKAVHGVQAKARAESMSGNEFKSIIYNKMRSYYFFDYFSSAAIESFFSDNESTLCRFGYGDLMSRASVNQ